MASLSEIRADFYIVQENLVQIVERVEELNLQLSQLEENKHEDEDHEQEESEESAAAQRSAFLSGE